jgi:hypothetical protein
MVKVWFLFFASRLAVLLPRIPTIILALIDSLACGNELCHYNTVDIEGDNQHGLELQMSRDLFAL